MPQITPDGGEVGVPGGEPHCQGAVEEARGPDGEVDVARTPVGEGVLAGGRLGKYVVGVAGG